MEVAALAQGYDQLIPRQIPQIDLAANYEHKHQELSPEDVEKGRHRMVVDYKESKAMFKDNPDEWHTLPVTKKGLMTNTLSNEACDRHLAPQPPPPS